MVVRHCHQLRLLNFAPPATLRYAPWVHAAKQNIVVVLLRNLGAHAGIAKAGRRSCALAIPSHHRVRTVKIYRRVCFPEILLMPEVQIVFEESIKIPR